MKKWQMGLLVGWVGLFIILRIFAINKTFVLFGDSARDLLELHEWEQTKLPPLLGPHTSALSFNQSASYFYWLMPFYLLSAHSVYTTNIAVLSYYLVWFGLGIYAFKKGWLTFAELIVIVATATIHPELIKQLRQVWNPSFVFPLTLAVGVIMTRVHWQTISTKTLTFFAFCLATAVGLSYSIIPFAVVVFIYSMYQLWKKHPQKNQVISKFILLMVTSVLAVNIGTIIFELKYDFLLTKNFSNQQVLQISTDQTEKWLQLTSAVIQYQWVWLVFIACLIFSLLLLKNNSERLIQLEKSMGLLFLTIGSTLLFPFAIHEHYIFGILALLIVVIMTMPSLPRLVMLLSFTSVSVGWLFSSNIFAVASPSTVEKSNCLKRICEQNDSPIYVVGNTSSHDHQALEYSYLAKEIGCNAFAVTEISSQVPKTLAVFNQKTNFELGKTDFYELNRFPGKKFQNTITCSPDLSVTIFSY